MTNKAIIQAILSRHVMMYRYILFLILIPLFLAACTSDLGSKKSDCKYGKAEAIFSPADTFVKEHRFISKNNEGEEDVRFSNEMQLQFVQSGCNTIQQELLFTNHQVITKDSIPLPLQAVQLLDYMGNLKTELKPFSFWAGAIAEQAPEFKRGKEVELEPHIFALIDQIGQDKNNMIRIVLSQR